MARPKLLVVTRHSPLPENDGAGAYLFDLLSYLARHDVEIEIAWVHSDDKLRKKKWWKVPAHIRQVAHLTIIGSLAIGPWRYLEWGHTKARIGSFLRRLRRPRRSPAPAVAEANGASNGASVYQPKWSALPTPLEARFFQKRLRSFRADTVLANYCWFTPLLPAEGRHFVLTHDVASTRLAFTGRTPPEELADHSLDPANPQGEARLLERARTILAISDEDAAVFRSWLPQHDIIVASKAALPRPPTGVPAPGTCLFVGSNNLPNQQGLHWFLQQVWPLVREARPDATLDICGSIERSVRQPPAGVNVLGRVDDLTNAYERAEVVIVPLLAGSGVKIKLVEAASHGKAIVTTPIGLQGLDFLRPSVREAASVEAFAQGVIDLLGSESLRSSFSQGTLAAIRNHLSPDSCYRPVLERLRG